MQNTPSPTRVVIDFEEGAASIPPEAIANFYQDRAIFSNAIWLNSRVPCWGCGTFSLGNVSVGTLEGEFTFAQSGWAQPGINHPIEVSFVRPLASISITGLDVGANGAKDLQVFDTRGRLVGESVFQGAGAGVGNRPLLGVTNDCISRIQLTQPFFRVENQDGLAWDNLAFTFLVVQCMPGRDRRRTLGDRPQRG